LDPEIFNLVPAGYERISMMASSIICQAKAIPSVTGRKPFYPSIGPIDSTTIRWPDAVQSVPMRGVRGMRHR